MTYYLVEPEVAGGIGTETVWDRSGAKPAVTKLHYQFDGWLGDQLLESTPCYIVTESIMHGIIAADLSGAQFDVASISTSEQFRDLYPKRQLPKFVWLKVVGVPGDDDFGVTPDLALVISERALQLLRQRGLSHALVRPYSTTK